MRFELVAKGPFSLAASVGFLRGFVPAAYAGGSGNELADKNEMRLAFVAEDGWMPSAVHIQPTPRGVSVTVAGACPEGLPQQVARMLSLDVDGRAFLAIGERDPVIGRLQRRYPGFRPVCFASAYEAAAWGILSHRIRMSQAAAIKRRLTGALGQRFQLEHETLMAFPTPQALLSSPGLPGVEGLKADRLREIAEAALRQVLHGGRLRGLDSDEALAQLRELPGVGPFTSELILIRGAGAPDVMATSEQRLQRAIQLAYGRGTTIEEVSPAWSPFRSWCAVLLRRWLEDERRSGAPSPTMCGIAS